MNEPLNAFRRMKTQPETLDGSTKTRLHPPRATGHRPLPHAALLAVVLFGSTARPALAAPQPSQPQTNATLPKAEEPTNHTVRRPTAASGTPTSSPRERPRTLTAAREQKNQWTGQPTKQEGGVTGSERAATDSGSMETYDAALVAVVQQRWHVLLDGMQVIPRSGKVVLDFNLNADGSITDMKMEVCEVGPFLGALCQAAVLDLAPYAPWPPEMRRAIGAGHRRVTVTFCSLDDDLGPSRFEARPPQAHLVCELRRHPRTLAQPVPRAPAWSQDDFLYTPLPAAWSVGYGSEPYQLFHSPLYQKRFEKDLRPSLEKDLQHWRSSLVQSPSVPALRK